MKESTKENIYDFLLAIPVSYFTAGLPFGFNKLDSFGAVISTIFGMGMVFPFTYLGIRMATKTFWKKSTEEKGDD